MHVRYHFCLIQQAKYQGRGDVVRQIADHAEGVVFSYQRGKVEFEGVGVMQSEIGVGAETGQQSCAQVTI